MKKIAKILPAFLALTLLFSGCSNGTNNASSSTGSTATTKIVVAFMSPANLPDLGKVQTALNKLAAVKKINAEVTLLPIMNSNYTQKVNLMISGGEQVDLCIARPFTTFVTQNELLPLNSLLDKYGDGVKKAAGSDWIKGTTVNGKIYAVPNIQPHANSTIVVRKDILDKYNLNLNDASLDGLTKLFAAVHSADPSLTCVAGEGLSSLFVLPSAFPLDSNYDSLGDGFGVLLGTNNYDVVDLYESDAYKKLVTTARDWNQKGYVLKDITTNTESIDSKLKTGKLFGFITTTGVGGDAQHTIATGYPMVAKTIAAIPYSSNNVSSFCWGIPVTCKSTQNQATAMKFLNLMYTDSSVINMLNYGIEGTDYVKVTDGSVTFPSGITASNAPYYPGVQFELGNEILCAPVQGYPEKFGNLISQSNKAVPVSRAMGFNYDNSTVKAQVTAVTNAVKQYGPGLDSGSVDPNTNLPKFIQALKSAGIDQIIKEKQTQLNTWVKANKK